MTAPAAILPPAPVDDERVTDPDMPPSGCRETLIPFAAFDEAARANDDGAYYALPCGCDAETDCPECAPDLWVRGRRIEEP